MNSCSSLLYLPNWLPQSHPPANYLLDAGSSEPKWSVCFLDKATPSSYSISYLEFRKVSVYFRFKWKVCLAGEPVGVRTEIPTQSGYLLWISLARLPM